MGNRNHANALSSFKYDDVENSSETFASGTTKTITNAHVKSTSFILIMWAVPISGVAGVVCSNGSFVITVPDALTNVSFKYRIL